jgi:uncharacterized ParB-like nuclease family protein
MHIERGTMSVTLSEIHCPICNGKHKYDFQALIDEVCGVMHMMTFKTETRACTVTCLAKGGSFVVDVPVSLSSGQTLVALK